MTKTKLIVALMLMSACVNADEVPRSISVTGSGLAEATPDRASIHMSIVVRNPSLNVAQDTAGEVTAKVLAMTDGLNIDRSRIDTTGASVRPDYRYNRDSNEQELRGYIAERQIKVEVRDLEKLAEVIEGAIKAGVNQVSAPQLFSSRRREAHREALANAAEDAQANAERLAHTLGMRLGAVLQIDAGSRANPVPVQRQAMVSTMAVNAESAATYNPGDQKIHATVTVEFELH